MSYRPIFVAIVASLVCLTGLVSANPFGSQSPTRTQLLSDLKLKPRQVREIRTILVGASKESIRLEAEMKISGIELREELAKEKASAAKVGKLIEEISVLEGKVRKSRVLSWLRVRGLLNKQQRERLKSMEQGRAVSTSRERTRTRRGVNVLNPFGPEQKEQTSEACDEVVCLVEPGRACCKQLGEVRDAIARHKAAPSVDCDEVTCLVNPEKDCCKTATLVVSTQGVAIIYVDGKRIGKSPLTYKLHPGAHRVKAVYGKGMQTKTSVVRLKAGDTRRIRWPAAEPDICANSRDPLCGL